jgi:hypothetical protein
MKLQNLFYAGALITGLSYIAGCNNDQPSINTDPSKGKYFAEFSVDPNRDIFKECKDFDNDGDLDFVIGLFEPRANNKIRFYSLENDGKGNFTIREPSKPIITTEKPILTPEREY